MAMTLAERTHRLTPPGTSRMRELANELRAAGEDVINFAAGELDGDASEVIKNAAKRAIDDGHNKYTPTLGTNELRQAIAEHVSRRCGVPYGREEVAVTAGAKQALYDAAMVLFSPGDEVIIPSPYWVTLPAQVELAGATPVFVDTRKSSYRLTASSVERAVTPATRAVIINSPNNPTGVVYDGDELARVADLALDRGFWIVFDECYSELVRPGFRHHNVVELRPSVQAQTILVNSFSKSHAVTGWRIGYAYGPRAVITAMENVQGHTTSNPCSISQYAALAALRDGDPRFMGDINATLEDRLRRAKVIVDSMHDVGCAPAEGAFYLFLDVEKKIGKAYKGRTIGHVDALSELILSEAKVAVVSGAAFGDASGLRVSYAIATRQVEEGLLRMKRLFDEIV
jgi:aspartate aminotransferase